MEPRTSGVALALAVFAAVIVNHTYAVEVKVYYQAQHEVCDKFITEQLHSTFMAVNTPKKRARIDDKSEYNSYMTVKLVPFGNAFELTQDASGTWELTCKLVTSYSAQTCAYTKYQACAASIEHSPWTSLNYINSMVLTGYTYPPTRAKLTCFDDGPMAPCVNSVDGDEILIRHGHDTMSLNVSMDSLPIVVFDGVYRPDEQAPARLNLLSVVCEKTGDAPGVCAQPRARRAMTHDNFGSGLNYPKKFQCEYR